MNQRFITNKYGTAFSIFKETWQELPQVSVLSAVLFKNIIINNVVNCIMNSHLGVQILFYVDDLVFWYTNEDNQVIQDSRYITLNTLQPWTKVNEMKINFCKTTFKVFTLSTKILIWHTMEKNSREPKRPLTWGLLWMPDWIGIHKPLRQKILSVQELDCLRDLPVLNGVQLRIFCVALINHILSILLNMVVNSWWLLWGGTLQNRNHSK